MAKRWMPVLVGAIGLAVGLAGCSSSPTTSGSTAPSTTATGAAGTQTSNLGPGQTVPFNETLNARLDVHPGTCKESGGSWVLRGTVTNSASSTRQYQIVVDFVTKPGGTVLATQEVTVPGVAPKQTKDWSASGAPGHSSVACLIRQVQAS
jgi:hypothetical protein